MPGIEYAKQFQAYLLENPLRLKAFDKDKNGLDANETKFAIKAFLTKMGQTGCLDETNFNGPFSAVAGLDGKNTSVSDADMNHEKFAENAAKWFAMCPELVPAATPPKPTEPATPSVAATVKPLTAEQNIFFYPSTETKNKLLPFVKAAPYSQESWGAVQMLLPAGIQQMSPEDVTAILNYAKSLPITLSPEAKTSLRELLLPFQVKSEAKQTELVKILFAAKYYSALPRAEDQKKKMFNQVVELKIENIPSDSPGETIVASHNPQFQNSFSLSSSTTSSVSKKLIKSNYIINSEYISKILSPFDDVVYHEIGHQVFDGQYGQLSPELIAQAKEKLKLMLPDKEGKLNLDLNYALSSDDELKSELFQAYMLNPKQFKENFREVYDAFSKQFKPVGIEE